MDKLENKIYISDERKEYLKRIRKKKFIVLFMQIALLVGFLVLWEFLANKGILDSFITSRPSRIVNTFMNLSSNNLLEHISVTTYETVIGFLLGTVIGVIIAIILWWSDYLAKIFEPYLVVLNSLPKVALRTYNNNLGRSRNISNNSNGNCNFSYCNYFRKFKWFSKNR